MADRRTRANQLDRRLISEHTAKSLRMQAAPIHVFSGRRHSRFRSGYTVTDIVADISDEEDDPVDTRVLPDDTIWEAEGARLNTELFDAYAPAYVRSPVLERIRPPQAETSPPATGESDVAQPIVLPVSPRSVSPPLRSLSLRSGLRSHGSGIGASLSRSDSIRRPARSRTVDFNEFTQRRRSSMRQESHGSNSVRAEAEDSADGTWRFRLSRSGSSRDSQPLASPSSFRPPPVVPAHYLARESWADTTEEGNADLPSAASSSSSGPSSSQTWFALTTGQPTPTVDETSTHSGRRSTISDIHEARRQVIAPRLRRGGVRPPETLLSRYASPAVVEGRDALPTSPPPFSRPPSLIQVLRQQDAPGLDNPTREMLLNLLNEPELPDRESTSQLPTPRSVTPAPEPAETHENPWQ